MLPYFTSHLLNKWWQDTKRHATTLRCMFISSVSIVCRTDAAAQNRTSSLWAWYNASRSADRVITTGSEAGCTHKYKTLDQSSRPCHEHYMYLRAADLCCFRIVLEHLSSNNNLSSWASLRGVLLHFDFSDAAGVGFPVNAHDSSIRISGTTPSTSLKLSWTSWSRIPVHNTEREKTSYSWVWMWKYQSLFECQCRL